MHTWVLHKTGAWLLAVEIKRRAMDSTARTHFTVVRLSVSDMRMMRYDGYRRVWWSVKLYSLTQAQIPLGLSRHVTTRHARHAVPVGSYPNMSIANYVHFRSTVNFRFDVDYLHSEPRR